MSHNMLTNKNFVLLGIVLISITPIHVYGEDEKSENGISTEELITIAGWILAPILGLVGYGIRLYMDRTNIQFAKDIEHEEWLLQKFHPLAEKYYFPLARFSFETYTSMKHASKSHDKGVIDKTYLNFGLFIAKYINFKNETGGNFLFRIRTRETLAIQKIRALLRIIPFDDIQINQIANEVNAKGSKFSYGVYWPSNYNIFSKWISSPNCKRSIESVIEKFYSIADNLDQGSEEISHPKLKSSFSKDTRNPVIFDPSQFYILSPNPKNVFPEEKVIIYGNGFLNELNKFEFYLGGHKIPFKIINDEYVELVIPHIDSGLYDIYAKFYKHTFAGKTDEEESVGLAVNIKKVI